MRWYKRDPDAALAGMIGLSLEERAVYNTVIDLLYSRDGDLPNEDRFFALACGCRPQMWRRVRDSLLAKNKLHYKTNGKLTANRVENELKTARKLMANMGENYDETGSKLDFQNTVCDEKTNKINGGDSNKEAADVAVHAREQPQPHPQPHPESISEPNGSAAVAAPDVRTELFREGLQKLIEATGKTPDSARSLIGRWLKETNDEAIHVKAAIEDAHRNRVADPVAWINRALAARMTTRERHGKRTVHEAAADLLEKVRSFNEPAPDEPRGVRDGTGECAVRRLSAG